MGVAVFFRQDTATNVAKSLVGRDGVTGFNVRRAFRRGQFLGFTITLQKGVFNVPYVE